MRIYAITYEWVYLCQAKKWWDKNFFYILFVLNYLGKSKVLQYFGSTASLRHVYYVIDVVQAVVGSFVCGW